MSPLLRVFCGFFCICFLSFSLIAQINITGTVKDVGGTGIAGAMVSVIAAGKSAVTDATGAYSIVVGTTAAVPHVFNRVAAQPCLRGNTLCFGVVNPSEKVRIELYDLAGRRVKLLLDKNLPTGNYQINPFTAAVSSQVYFLKVRVGANAAVFKMPLGFGTGSSAGHFVKQYNGNAGSGFSKTFAATDSMLAGAVGYTTAGKTIDSYTGVYDFVLDRTVSAGGVLVIQTSQAGDKLAIKPALTFAADDGSTMTTITVDTAQKYQTMVGFGASFTESSVYNMDKVGAQKRKEILNAFFNPYTGAGYTLCRTHINSCDFSLTNYSYDDSAGDYELKYFSIEHEKKWMIPAMKVARAVPGSDFLLFGSPWSPPAWMKQNGVMNGGSPLKPECYTSWALYFSKFIKAYEAEGVHVWGITIQNEPEFWPPWDGCQYTAAQERDFLKNYLGPQLVKDSVKVKVMIFDHNKDHVAIWANTILGDTAAAKYAWGVAYHWYSGDQFTNLTDAHNAFPWAPLIATECSLGGTAFGDAEGMVHSIIGDINNWSSGWLTWNLVTDENRGPCHVNNSAPSPIMINFSTGGTVQYNPDYYCMAHFSKYVRPGAVRIGYSATGIPANVEFTAFRNTNGSVVVVVMNRSANAAAVKIKQGSQIIKPTIPAHALINFIY